jgi:hypothetical protein
LNQNKLVKFATGLVCQGAQILPQSCVGYPLFSYFNYPVTYVDRNRNGILDTSEVAIGSTPRFLGQSYPKSQATGQSTIALFNGSVSMRAAVDYRGGFSTYEWEQFDQGSMAPAVYVRGSSLHDQAAYLASQRGNLSGYLADASFARLRVVALTYRLPGPLLRWVHTQTASVTVSALNLFVWSRFIGGDPEASGATGSQALGGYYPASALGPPRTWLVRFNLGI